MEANNKYHTDISEIRSMMERSTRFLSLSGWSGVLAGIYALAASFFAYRIMADARVIGIYLETEKSSISRMLILALCTLILAVGTAVVFAMGKSRKSGQNIWTPVARRLVYNMAVPLATGGVLSAIMFAHSLILFIPAVMLLFYGLTLWTAGKFTFEEIKHLGLISIILGLAAAYYPAFGLLFWAIGFGLMHIIYGIYLHVKYEK